MLAYAVVDEPDAAEVAVVDDYSNKDIREALKNREARQADGVTRSEIAFVALAEAAVACWTEWCEVPGGIKIEQRLDRKFRLCFPLCANAINHVEAALAMRSRYPWSQKLVRVLHSSMHSPRSGFF